MPAIGEDIHNLLAIGLYAFAALLGSAHALLNKRDPRSAAAWIALCVFFPIGGLIIYLLIGNNRIRTRARLLHARSGHDSASPLTTIALVDAEHLIAPEYRNLAYLGRAASGNTLLTGNLVEPLKNGDEAYPAMLDAIRGARSYVHLASYIFDSRGIGREFATALRAAQDRGVAVRVLLDGFGEYYSLPRAGSMLRRAGVRVLRFLPPRLLPPNFWVNLRNHRKILVVDGVEAFTGGMNIRDKHSSAAPGVPPRVVDLHFRLRGPVVGQIDAVFRADWIFTSREWLPMPEAQALMPGGAECRVIVDGPNEDRDKLLWVMLGAIALARSSIKIMTPYFLPPRELAVALQIAALRGVAVTVLLPANNNFPFMTWAAMHDLPELLRAGVRVALTEGPFVHSKLLLVDDYYAQVGSSNLDPRSLRLNFEMAVEVYDHAFGSRMATHFDASLARSQPLDPQALRNRGLVRRLRDAVSWLFSPYL